jgi:hypothetical protein
MTLGHSLLLPPRYAGEVSSTQEEDDDGGENDHEARDHRGWYSLRTEQTGVYENSLRECKRWGAQR